MYANFGEMISKKRTEKKITLRKLAELLNVSPAFLSDVERGRRNPFDDRAKLDQLSELFNLSQEEYHDMLDLVGDGREEVAPDLPEYINGHDYVRVALRTARDLDAGEEEWLQFVEELKNRKG